jgi:hypothetical protein
MRRWISSILAGLEVAYRDQGYFAALKARLFVAFACVVCVIVPINAVRILLVQGPQVPIRIAMNALIMAGALAAIRTTWRGRLELAA